MFYPTARRHISGCLVEVVQDFLLQREGKDLYIETLYSQNRNTSKKEFIISNEWKLVWIGGVFERIVQSLYEIDTKKPNNCDRCYYSSAWLALEHWLSFWNFAIYEDIWSSRINSFFQPDERSSIENIFLIDKFIVKASENSISFLINRLSFRAKHKYYVRIESKIKKRRIKFALKNGNSIFFNYYSLSWIERPNTFYKQRIIV